MVIFNILSMDGFRLAIDFKKNLKKMAAQEYALPFFVNGTNDGAGLNSVQLPGYHLSLSVF